MKKDKTRASRGSWLAFSVGAFSALLAGCTQHQETVDNENILAFDKEVSEADLRTARLLSLSNNGVLQTISDPYELSVACIVSIQSIAERLRTMNAVTTDQLSAIDAAVRLYRQRALNSGKSPAELNQDIEKRRADEVDVNQQGRIGISCLRQLA